MSTNRTCKHCGSEYPPRHGNTRYCGPKCVVASRRARSPLNPPNEISSGAIGAMNELLVCADLTRRGYHVFRAVSPSAPCDLMMLSPAGDKLRVEVKTGDSLYCIDPSRAEIYAFVTAEGVQYVPDVNRGP